MLFLFLFQPVISSKLSTATTLLFHCYFLLQMSHHVKFERHGPKFPNYPIDSCHGTSEGRMYSREMQNTETRGAK